MTPARIASSRSPVVALAVGARLVFGVDLLEVGHADDAARSRRAGCAFTPYSVSPRWNDQIRGPKPTKNSVTFMPDALGREEVAGLVQHDHERCSADDDRDDRRAAAGRTRSEQRRPASEHARRVIAGAASRLTSTLDVLERISSRSRGLAWRSTTRCALARDPVGFENVGDLIGVPGAGVRALRRRSRRSPSTGCGRPGRPRPRPRWPRSARRRGAAGPPGLVGEAEAREGVEVGRLERERAERRSSRSRRTPRSSRSGAPRARPIGRRMSGIESWAMVAPSVNSTIQCTTDCGCTTTSMRSKSTPNSSCASITSRPLFMSVDESIVILAPIVHVGCCERVGDGDRCELGSRCGRGTVRRSR